MMGETCIVGRLFVLALHALGLPQGESVVALRSSVPRIRVAGLERTARLAGESFGHEELVRLDRMRPAATPPSRWLWGIVALLSIAGLSLLGLR
jgi:hypothetical protein